MSAVTSNVSYYEQERANAVLDVDQDLVSAIANQALLAQLRFRADTVEEHNFDSISEMEAAITDDVHAIAISFVNDIFADLRQAVTKLIMETHVSVQVTDISLVDRKVASIVVSATLT